MELMKTTVRVPGSRIESRLRAAPHYNGAVARIGKTRWMADEPRICMVRTQLAQGDAQASSPQRLCGVSRDPLVVNDLSEMPPKIS